MIDVVHEHVCMESIKQKIADLLEQSIGLTVSSIGSSTFQRALNNRKNFLGIADDEAYLEKLTVSYMELRRLVEEVVVPETWFFRDQEPFTFLMDYVHKSPKDFSLDILRILSLPCSTGEEPYSIAMTLLQAGLKPSSFYIDAVDVSNKSLATARLGIYKQNSFRTKNLDFRDNFFHKIPQGYSLNNTVREKVRFVQGNILQPGFVDSLGLYDVVFCRNLLIYFNKDSQAQAIKGIYDLLVPDGLFFTGHSEAGLFLGSMFSPVTHSRAFAFNKQQKKEQSAQGGGLKSREKVTEETAEVLSRPKLKRPRHVRKQSQPSGTDQQDDFSSVQKLADMGQLEEAARLCEKHIQQLNPSAKWYYLLGVISDSQGKPDQAKKHFRKAVYLDPGNVESLVQLSLLAERAGLVETAENYKRRARIIQEKG